MRSAILAWTICGLCAHAAGSDVQFPYRAYVTVEDVYVRSGPGQSYYATDKLKRGEVVEVYRHDPGGWFAIRPPDGSYSWVSARFIDPKGENLGTINEENVAARVGSRFSDVRDAIQIKLRRGEVVELLEERGKSAGPGDESDRWCKIAPPAGEFRWVFGKYVDANYSPDGVKKATPADKTPAVAGNVTPQGTSSAPAASADSGEKGGVRAEIDAIDMELGVIVVEDPSLWSLDSLQRRAEALLDRAETAVDRGHVRILLKKIERFASIKARNDSLVAAREDSQLASRLLSGLPSRQSSAATRAELLAQAADNNRRFDGTGRLAEVPSPKMGGPRYALLDDRGQVRWYVTPAPGVNLRYYVGRQVGISGTRGFMPEERAQHLVARHVNSLDDGNLIR